MRRGLALVTVVMGLASAGGCRPASFGESAKVRVPRGAVAKGMAYQDAGVVVPRGDPEESTTEPRVLRAADDVVVVVPRDDVMPRGVKTQQRYGD
ncbi:MAG: hypothetical protein K0V04_42670 [Deltaproteobacteria bacterium]|nr:hypothetical protein [Deltaproteobacteria bacterium]